MSKLSASESPRLRVSSSPCLPHLHGLVAATHTPFKADGSVNFSVVEQQAAGLQKNKIAFAFINGTTGEGHSLTQDERKRLAARWIAATKGTKLKVIVHVGSNCIEESRALSAHAQKIGAGGIAALAPSYFKPRNVATLVDCCARIAGAAPELPFYYYDIPAMTGVLLSMPDFLAQGREKIPTLAGIKWTNPDLYTYQLCLNAHPDLDLPWGNDEYLLAGLALGAKGAVGSTYNFGAPIYHRIFKAVARGDLAAAREDQHRSCLLVKTLAGQPYGYMGAAKALMGLLGVPVGPARLPNLSPTPEQVKQLRADLEGIGFFGWI